MSEHERNVLITLARTVMPSTVLEIGLQEGQAARMLLDNVPSIKRYVGVDTDEGYVHGIPAQGEARERPFEPGRLVLGDKRFERILLPRGSYDLVPDSIGTYDMIIIDGDHSREAVTHDTMLADTIVNSRGLLIWHDYGAWCDDITSFLDSRHASGHSLFHAANTMLVWEMIP